MIAGPHPAWAALLFGVALAMPVAAQVATDGVATTLPATPVPAAEPCRAVDLRAGKADAVPLVAAACGTKAAILGEAVRWTATWNAGLSSLLVVRQRPYRTEVSVAVLGADGSVHVEELAPGIAKALAKAGRSQSPLLTVDAAAFAGAGTIAVTPERSPAVKVATAARGAASLPALTVDLKPAVVLARDGVPSRPGAAATAGQK